MDRSYVETVLQRAWGETASADTEAERLIDTLVLLESEPFMQEGTALRERAGMVEGSEVADRAEA